MKISTPIRIDNELYAAAATVARLLSRSTTQQISHWARIGRELEASPEVSTERVAQVLRGACDYDALNAEEQAVVRAWWAERMSSLAAALRLDRRFEAEGRPYVELDEEGNVVRHDPESGKGRTLSSPGDLARSSDSLRHRHRLQSAGFDVARVEIEPQALALTA